MFWAPTDYLEHHGILGQKWGQRNGPPYPLSEKKAKRVARLVKNGGANPDYMKGHKRNKAVLKSNSYVRETLVNDKDYIEATKRYRSLIVPYRQEWAQVRSELSDDSKYDEIYKELQNKLKKEGKDPYPTSDEVIDYAVSKNNPELYKALEKSADSYNSSIEKVVEKMLGKYGDETFERFSTNVSISQATREFVLNEGENIVGSYIFPSIYENYDTSYSRRRSSK